MEDMYTKKTNAPRANNVKKINSKPFNRFVTFLSLLIIIVAFSMVILPKKQLRLKTRLEYQPRLYLIILPVMVGIQVWL